MGKAQFSELLGTSRCFNNAATLQKGSLSFALKEIATLAWVLNHFLQISKHSQLYAAEG